MSILNNSPKSNVYIGINCFYCGLLGVSKALTQRSTVYINRLVESGKIREKFFSWTWLWHRFYICIRLSCTISNEKKVWIHFIQSEYKRTQVSIYIYICQYLYFLFSHIYHRIEDGWKHIGHMNTLHSNDTRLIKKTVFQWCVCGTNLVQENSQKRWQFQRQPMYDVQCNECTASNVFNIMCQSYKLP